MLWESENQIHSAALEVVAELAAWAVTGMVDVDLAEIEETVGLSACLGLVLVASQRLAY